MEFIGTLSWFKNRASEVSAHIVIAAGGAICEVVPSDRVAWHAPRYNATHLGIEFVKRDPSVYTDVITEAQYKSAAWWLVRMSLMHSFPLITPLLPEHREIQMGKIDIGTGFDRATLMGWIARFQG